MNTESEQNEVIKLPLWKTCLDVMREKGIHHGQEWKAEFFEEHLRCTRDTMEFSLLVSSIRRELEKDGYYLSGRGHNGKLYDILPPSDNQEVMLGYAEAAADALRRGVILGTNTRLDLLDKKDRERHEKILEKLATKSMLLRHSQTAAKVLQKKSPKLLK